MDDDDEVDHNDDVYDCEFLWICPTKRFDQLNLHKSQGSWIQAQRRIQDWASPTILQIRKLPAAYFSEEGSYQSQLSILILKILISNLQFPMFPIQFSAW